MLVGNYNYLLVFFSLLVAIFASYTALDMASRVTSAQGRTSYGWLAGGACAMGTGIWAMHFVGMLAFNLPIPIGYDPEITLLSLLIAVFFSAFALWIVCQKTLPWGRLILASVVMGLGISGMHYTGMAAMQMVPGIQYIPSLFFLSIVIAILASGAALWIAFMLRHDMPQVRLRRAEAAVVMGLTIVGMHYTGMVAAQFPSGSVCGAAHGTLPTGWLALAIIVVTLAVMTVALIISVLDFRLESRTREFVVNLRIAATAFDSQESLMITDAQGVILRVNQAFTESTGYTAEEAVGQTPRLLKSGRHGPDFYREMWESTHRTGKWQGEVFDKRKNGEIFPKLLTISAVKGDDGTITHYVGSHIDITDRKIVENELARHTQLYATLSQCNKAIVHCANEDTLFQEICLAIVQLGGMKMSWIGMIAQDGKTVIPVTHAGTGTAYLNDIHVSTAADELPGCGPVGISIRENQPFWRQDFQNDPVTIPWRDRGAVHEWGACAALPLHRNGVPIGALAVYASEINAFDALTRNLLIEMATDISFALDTLDRESRRKQAEEALRNSETRLRLATEMSNVAIWEYDVKADQMTRSTNHDQLYGMAWQGTWRSATFLNATHPDDRERAKDVIYSALAPGGPDHYAFDFRVVRPDNSLCWLWVKAVIAQRDPSGNGLLIRGILIDITERVRANEALMESQTRLDLALRSAELGVWSLDLVSNTRHYDDQTCHLLGIDPQTFTGTAEEFFRVVHSDDVDIVKATLARSIEQNIPYDLEYRVLFPNDSIHYISSRARIERGKEGEPLRFIGILWDVTERKHAEKALRESQERLDLALRSARMSVWSLDIGANTRYFDTQYCQILGIDPASFTGAEKEFFRVVHADDREMVKSRLAETIEQNVPYESEFRVIWPDGSIHHIASRGRLVQDEQGLPLRINGIAFDVSDWKEAQSKIHSLAFYDPLTGLPNRRLLMDRLQHALASSVRNGKTGAILFVDLDNFKTINDTVGHALGDLLLQQVAARLASCVREEDTVARIGGDEFVIMLEGLGESESEAATHAESIGIKILGILGKPYQISLQEYRSTSSIGITLFNARQRTTDELLKQADIAMYQAKKSGRNMLRFFDAQMQKIITERAALEGELRQALENRQFELYYQIQVDKDQQPIGAEALLRWVHPERGLVSPQEFIALAEETGLILPIGQWVLEAACAQLRVWQQGAQTLPFTLSINVSAKEFRQADFAAQVQATVRRHGIDPKLLKLELTESLLLEDIEATVTIMNVLNEIGVQFSLDDFGTGYSSLQYLKRLPLNQIKIDQSFVRDLPADSGDRVIVRTMIAMAKSLNLGVIAEGVETEEQLQLLLSNGCTHFQGYLFGEPVPIGRFVAPG